MHADDWYATADRSTVARARERFLNTETEPDPLVRRVILASWQRSRESQVEIDRINVPYVPDHDLHTPLVRTASPILGNLHDELREESVSIILTDQTGLVLDRRTSGSAIAERLDSVNLAPGFSYAEEYVGTNGIGTAISRGGAALVDGREHYSSPLGQFACAGAPIHHPTSRKVMGILDLTTSSGAPGSMLVALASATARRIEDELLAQTGVREFALFQEYMRLCQQSGGPVLAVNPDVVMMNENLRMLFDPPDQQSLIGYAADALRGQGLTATRTVELPSGRMVHLKWTSVGSTAGQAGGVFRVRVAESETRGSPGRLPVLGYASMSMPGIVGAGPAWVRCVHQLNAAYDSGEWLALSGEVGSGRRALLRAAHLLHNPTQSFRIIDPPRAGELTDWVSATTAAIERPGRFVVIPRADELDPTALTALAESWADVPTDSAQRARVAITIGADAVVPEPLMTAISRTIEVPPLRHHIEDLALLVPHLLSQLPGGDRLTISAKALAQLSRLSWPGNVGQLRKMLGDIAKLRHSGVVEIADLPPEGLVPGRRVLSPIEALERDAIVRALIDNDERPARAAEALGMSRATIYRKLRQYGITLPLAR